MNRGATLDVRQQIFTLSGKYCRPSQQGVTSTADVYTLCTWMEDPGVLRDTATLPFLSRQQRVVFHSYLILTSPLSYVECTAR